MRELPRSSIPIPRIGPRSRARRGSAAITVACVMSVLGACSEERALYSHADDQVVLFAIRYVNGFTAYGTHRSGMYIDDAGWVYRYESNDVDGPQTDYYVGDISADQLMQLFSQGRVALGRINVDTLARRAALIPACAEGVLEAHWSGIADAGLVTYCAYVFDREADSYRQITLRVRGDIEVENSAPDSITLSDWLLRVAGDYCGLCMR